MPKKKKPPAGPTLQEKTRLLEYFPELWLGQKPYEWQRQVLRAIDYKGSRVYLKAANGSGKTSTIVAAAVLWHMGRFPGSQTVCTAGVYRQVVEVLWPVLRNMSNGLGGKEMGWEVTENRIRFTNPGVPGSEPSICNGFSAEKPESAEGWHARGPSNNLLYVIDEAKAVPDSIFAAMERCQPTRLLVLSSPGGCSGAFYQAFANAREGNDLFTVTAHDCPHIPKTWINEQIAMHGERSALVRSMIFAEFGEEDGNSLILPPSVLQRAISSPPAKDGTQLWAGCDFAAGGDENVIQVRKGNAIEQTIAWREKDTMAAVGRFITEFKRLGLEADHIYGDGSGLGLPMCDALREAGWPINRVNNGEAAFSSEKFANRGTEMWVQFARLVETGKVVIPPDEQLHKQLTNRRLLYNSKGKLMAEPKPDMKKRAVDSPDRADAIVLAFCGMGQSVEDYVKRHGGGPTLADLARYAGMEDEEEAGAGMAGMHAG